MWLLEINPWKVIPRDYAFLSTHYEHLVHSYALRGIARECGGEGGGGKILSDSEPFLLENILVEHTSFMSLVHWCNLPHNLNTPWGA